MGDFRFNIIDAVGNSDGFKWGNDMASISTAPLLQHVASSALSSTMQQRGQPRKVGMWALLFVWVTVLLLLSQCEFRFIFDDEPIMLDLLFLSHK